MAVVAQRTSAFQAGLRTGDVIVEIDGEATGTMTHSDLAQKTRVEAGSSMKLKAIRAYTHEAREYTIAHEDAAHWTVQSSEPESPAATPADPTTAHPAATPATLLPATDPATPF